MSAFTMYWPRMNLRVRCGGIDKNREALELFARSLPSVVVQGHELVGGWALRCRSFHFTAPFGIGEEALSTAKLKDLPEGAVCLLFPQGSTAELLVKYGACADDRSYVPIGQVRAADLEALKAAGAAVWKEVMNTQEIITCEINREVAGQ